MKLTPLTVGLAAGALGLGLVALFVWRRGVAGAAADLGGAAVSAAGGVATGVINGVSGAVGLPTTTQTTTDPAVARWVIDNYGYFEASKWAGAPALAKGWWMEAGTGTPPPAGTALAAYLATQVPIAPAVVDDDETARLLRRYPAPEDYFPVATPGYAWGA